MADYQCWPLWLQQIDGSDNTDPSNLPLKQETIDRLKSWAVKYDSTLNQDDPASSGFGTELESDMFEKEGRELWNVLNNELKDLFHISYQSIKGKGEIEYTPV